MKIQCINIKCQGCVNKIQESLGEKYPSLKVDIPSQTIDVQATQEEEKEIKAKLSELGFLPNEGFMGKIKSFFK